MDNMDNVVVGKMLKVEVKPSVELQEMVLVALDEIVRAVNDFSPAALEVVSHWYGMRWSREELERQQKRHDAEFERLLDGMKEMNGRFAGMKG